jgi:hypothetical protein
MGIYVYSMRKPVKHVEFKGEGYEIARVQFLVKCWNINESKVAKMQVAKCENAFPRVPKFVVMGEKWANGMEVHRWMGEKPWAYDTPGLPCYKMGILRLPTLKIIPDRLVAMPFKYVPAGGRFSMGLHLLTRFNAEVIDKPWIADEFKKGVTYYGESDVFEMDEMGVFKIIRGGQMFRYRVNHLPDCYNEWTVKVDTDHDMTNEFEAMYS